MTKAELIAALERLPDDCDVLIESWPADSHPTGPNPTDLFALREVVISDEDGPGAPAFASLVADVRYLP